MSPVLLVTGGSRGIGAATAKLAGMRGFDVAVNYVANEAAAVEIVAAIKGMGQRAVAIQADMAKEADVARTFATVDRELGRLTHFVYSSGITGAPSRFDQASAETFRAVLDLNVFGALIAAKEAVLRMSTRHGGQGGAMVLLSSAAATLGSPGEYVWYAASKGAIDSLTIGLAREFAAEGIRVNAVAPGLIATDIHAPGRLDRLAPSAPLARAGAAEEVADAILYLLSEAASYVTGVTLRVSGGR